MAKFVVVADNYEYNDEYFSQPEDEAYKIESKLYPTKEEAEQEAANLNASKGFWGSTGGWEDDYRNEDVVRNPNDPSEIWITPYRVVKIDE